MEIKGFLEKKCGVQHTPHHKIRQIVDQSISSVALLEIRDRENPLGHHKSVIVTALAQVGDDHACSVTGSVDHLAFPDVDARMAHGVAGPAEVKKVSRQQLGIIQGVSYRLSHLGLLTAGAGKIDFEPFINILHEPGTVRGVAAVEGGAHGIGRPLVGLGHAQDQIPEVPGLI